MTQEQAQAQREAIDQNNEDSGFTDRLSKLIHLYNIHNFTDNFQVCNIPSEYSTQYDDANFDLQVAFFRIAMPIQVQTDFVERFKADAKNDPELAEYLGLNETEG